MMMCPRWRLSTSHVARWSIVLVCLAVLSGACGQRSAPRRIESKPKLSIEVPAASDSLLLPFRIAGWSIDLGADSGTGVERVEIRDGGCDGQLVGVAEYGFSRPDVAQLYGDTFKNSGWQLLITRLGNGSHVLGVRMYSALNGDGPCDTLDVSVL